MGKKEETIACRVRCTSVKIIKDEASGSRIWFNLDIAWLRNFMYVSSVQKGGDSRLWTDSEVMPVYTASFLRDITTTYMLRLGNLNVSKAQRRPDQRGHDPAQVIRLA